MKKTIKKPYYEIIIKGEIFTLEEITLPDLPDLEIILPCIDISNIKPIDLTTELN